MQLKQLLANIKLPNAELITLRKVKISEQVSLIRNGKPESNYFTIDEGIMVEVLAHGIITYAATSDLSIFSIQKAAEHAMSLATHAAKYSVFSYTPAQRFPGKGKYISPRKITQGNFISKNALESLTNICNKLKVNSQIINAISGYKLIEYQTEIVSTHGAQIEQNILATEIILNAVAQNSNQTQERSLHGSNAHTKQVGLECLNETLLLAEAERVANEAIELLSADECPTTTADLVLSPSQMILQIHESIGHPLELDRILGDERNYAGSSFVKPTDFGNLQYGSPLLNISFDPTIASELASYSFDDAGFPATKVPIIQNGILKNPLGSAESTARYASELIQPTANLRACSWDRPPIDRMANLNMEPGKSSVNEIISSIEYGIFMQDNRSWSIDDYRNKFQFGCEYAKLIENGKLTKTLRNPNYRGISVPFWNSLFHVGNADSFNIFGISNCGKGEPQQAIWVGHSSPMCAFHNVEIFGGAN